MQNSPCRRDNRNRKAFAVHINSKNVLLQRQFGFFFGKISNNLKSGSNPIGLACLTRLNKVRISLEISVLNDRNRDRILRKQRELYEGHRFREGLAVSGNAELECNSFGFAFAFPYRTFNIADNLRIKRGAFLD
ncbi:MAG: hypothetical protein M1569_00855 [Candidatus Marsarchaeota archaeon]|nr:hypothetical protein [Candidatus Marsarchaeota archaeon]